MILVIDNYDSFVYNLARHMALAGWSYDVVRNDAISVEQVQKTNPRAIVLSPGPCTPKEAGICVELIQRVGPQIPVLGVCLGHQCIGTAYGADIVLSEPVHGRASVIRHQGDDALFAGIPAEFKGGRYHSLVVDLPPQAPLKATAHAENGEIMALRHTTYPVYGVQFHPESILTEHGMTLIRNFTQITLAWHNKERIAA